MNLIINKMLRKIMKMHGKRQAFTFQELVDREHDVGIRECLAQEGGRLLIKDVPGLKK
jgi:hypothetical protein